MGKYSKNSGSQQNRLMVVCVVLAVVLVLLILAAVLLGRGQRPGVTADFTPETAGEKPQAKELAVQSVADQNDFVLVTTTYGTVKYPLAFSDIMSVEVEAFEDYAALTFNAMIDGAAVKLYAMQFNSEEGIPVGTLKVDGKTYEVTAQLYDATDISDENMVTFDAAQETLNDVIHSLSENEGFTATD